MFSTLFCVLPQSQSVYIALMVIALVYRRRFGFTVRHRAAKSDAASSLSTLTGSGSSFTTRHRETVASVQKNFLRFDKNQRYLLELLHLIEFKI